jgi:hypothetical protein
MVAFLSHWLSEEEVRSWVRACARFAASGPEAGAPPNPWPVVRTAVEELLEAKKVVDLYHENDQEGPDALSADLAALLQVLPPRRRASCPSGAPRAQLLLHIHTKEILERCQRTRRRAAGDLVRLL